jgi:hypothetical protein
MGRLSIGIKAFVVPHAKCGFVRLLGKMPASVGIYPAWTSIFNLVIRILDASTAKNVICPFQRASKYICIKVGQSLKEFGTSQLIS